MKEECKNKRKDRKSIANDDAQSIVGNLKDLSIDQRDFSPNNDPIIIRTYRKDGGPLNLQENEIIPGTAQIMIMAYGKPSDLVCWIQEMEKNDVHIVCLTRVSGRTIDSTGVDE